VSATAEQLAKALVQKDYNTLENLWLELLEADTIPAEPVARILADLVAAGDGPRALDLALALAPELLRAERYEEALPLLRAAAPAAGGNEEFRAGLLQCYRRLYRRLPHVAACIDRSGLLTSDDLAAAVATLDRLLSYREGDYFYHAAGWGLGQIAGFDPLTTNATIDFEHKPGHHVPLETIETIFERLAPDDFRVLRRTHPERLSQMAQDDPVGLVHMVLAANDRRISARALREALTAEALPAEAWTKWWNATRTALKRDPHVAIPAGGNPILTLRAEALTYEDATRARFDALKDLHHKTELIREYTEHMGEDADPELFLAPAARHLAAAIPNELNPGHAFEASLLLTKLRVDAGDFPQPEQIVAPQADPIPLLNGLTTNVARARAFQILRETSQDWHGLCYQVLSRGPRALWEAAVAELPLTGEPASIEALVRQVMDDPRRHLELFSWVCRGLFLERWTTAVPLIQAFDKLLSEGDTLARRKAYQRGDYTRFTQDDAIADIRQSLRVGDLDYFDRILVNVGEAEASRILFRVRQSSVLTAIVTRALEQKLIRRYPKLLVEEEHAAEPAVEYIYATPAAIAKRRKEHEHVVNVEIPKNSEDIARAAAMGDISDSADWRAAIQEQQVLNVRAIEMGRELQLARPIEPSMVAADRVSIGSRVTIENTQSGERATYAILGPWDSDDEHGIIAYAAPLGKCLLRHGAGDEVVFEHSGEKTTYRIIEIGDALKQEQAEA